LPSKVKCITNDLMRGVVHRTTPKFIDRVFSRVGEFEKRGAKAFGENIQVNNNCNGCGWCKRSCPANNISMLNNRPMFGVECLLCLKCIYGCPNKALEAGTLKFTILKEGYDLNALEKRMEGVELAPVEDLAKSYLWKGVKKYLLED
ncbi:MAG: EFR1 family ferrodoxin, partial [Desulfobacterales bacterium]|nr:EFR1 family ferrodoxin [Desulfobacterales bacterium]